MWVHAAMRRNGGPEPTPNSSLGAQNRCVPNAVAMGASAQTSCQALSVNVPRWVPPSWSQHRLASIARTLEKPLGGGGRCERSGGAPCAGSCAGWPRGGRPCAWSRGGTPTAAGGWPPPLSVPRTCGTVPRPGCHHPATTHHSNLAAKDYIHRRLYQRVVLYHLRDFVILSPPLLNSTPTS